MPTPTTACVPRCLVFLGEKETISLRATTGQVSLPFDFPDVNAAGETFLTAHGIGTLRDGLQQKRPSVCGSVAGVSYMSMKRARIIVFDEDVHRAIVMIPAVLDLLLARDGRPVEEDIQSDRKAFTGFQRRMICNI